LSIQVSLSGLSFCILDTSSRSFSYYHTLKFGRQLSPEGALDQVLKCFESEKILQKAFDTVNVIHENELSALVPQSLFNEEHLADYLKFNSKILSTDYFSYDQMTAHDCVNVYVPFMNINNHLYERFGEFEFRHFSTILIEAILALEKHSKIPKMYVNVSDLHFEIIVVEHNKLVLYNTYEYLTKEDFIYYILFTAEQLHLNPEEFQLTLIGYITLNDDLFEMAYKYVRHIEILDPKSAYNMDNVEDLGRNFVLLNSF
jgi:hypothetical protein